MRGDHNNIIHKRLKSCGSSLRPTGGYGNKCKGVDGHHAIGFQAAKLRYRGRGTFLQADFTHEFVLRYELRPKGRSSSPLHRREKRLSGNAGSVQSNPRSDS
jgi:hypothetical protein